MVPAAAELAERLGLSFTDLGLLRQALIHSSYVHEHPEVAPSNERLEFLGDSVLALIVAEQLWQLHPAEDEGSLSTRRAAIVSTTALSSISRRLDLGHFVLLGQGATAAGERHRPSVLAATLEAVIGAVFLEFGLPRTRRWLLRVAAPELRADRSSASRKPPKSRLQELSYARSGRPPQYRLLSDEGPAHDRHYVVEAVLEGVALGRGEGRNRRTAETAAAEQALMALGEPTA